MFERLKELPAGKGGMSAGFFHGGPGRQIRVHKSGGILRRGLQVFALAALVTGASFLAAPQAAQAGTLTGQQAVTTDQTVSFNGISIPDKATDLDTSHGFAHGEAMIRQVAQDKQFIVFGDTNHGHAELRQFMAQKGTIDALADAGVKKIILELPESLQPEADKYMKRAISREAFIETLNTHAQLLLKNRVEGLQERTFNSVADMMDRARERGMGVYFVNVFEAPKSLNTLAGSVEKAWVHHADENGIDKNDISAMVSFMSRYIQDNKQKELADIGKGIFKKRLEDERRAAAMKKVAGSDKTAIFYGAGHFSNVSLDNTPRPRDLDEYLGSDKVVVINLHRDQAALQEYAGSSSAGPDKPDHVYVLSSDSVLPGGAGAAPQRVSQARPAR